VFLFKWYIKLVPGRQTATLIDETDGSIVVFSMTSYKSFENVTQIIGGLRENLPVYVVANKCESKNVEVTPAEFKQLLKSNGWNGCVYSAKAATNFEKPFLYFARLFTGQNVTFTE